MRRYTTRPKLWYQLVDYDGCENLDSMGRTVHEPDASPYKTGLLDKDGNDIFAVDSIEPIGFVRFED